MKNKQGFSGLVTIIIIAILIGGYAVWKKQAVAPTDDSLSTLGVDRDVDTTDWKTYRNEHYGFEVKYPSGLNILSQRGVVNLEFRLPPNDNTDIGLSVLEPPGSCFSGDIDFRTDERIELSEITFYHLDYYRGGIAEVNRGHQYVGERGRECYTFSLIPGISATNDQAHSVMDQILSTFKFTK